MKRLGKRTLRGCAGIAGLAVMASLPVVGQSQTAAPSGQADTDARIASLEQSLLETRQELAETRTEMRELRSLLEKMNEKMGASAPAPAPATGASQVQQASAAGRPVSVQPAAAAGTRLAQITSDDWQILNAKVDQQAQEKVESGSKNRLTLWGIALFNAFSDAGGVDGQDAPTLALPRSPGSSAGSLGASVRQSIVGLTGTGPELIGARTSADVQMDFFGGLPSGYSATSSGIFRLRLARIRFDWSHTSLIGGLDTPFFSPNTPTSYMSLALPAFAASGNLWAWSPALRVEQRFDTRLAEFKIEAGVLDPSSYAAASAAVRLPTPGESSRQPVYAVRLSANGTHGERPASVGFSGIYFPQRFTGGAKVAGWGGVADWRFPLVPHTELSGEFFAGKGLDSFGAVPVPVIQPQNYNTYIQGGAPALAGITMLGGWSQLKVVLDSRNEFNVALGTGARRSEYLAQAATLFPPLAALSPRNEMLFVNYVFRPRSDLLFSAEYRRLRTYPLFGAPALASQIGLAAGFLF